MLAEPAPRKRLCPLTEPHRPWLLAHVLSSVGRVRYVVLIPNFLDFSRADDNHASQHVALFSDRDDARDRHAFAEAYVAAVQNEYTDMHAA